MNIRNMTVQDYLEVDQLMQQLHKLHVKGRPDLYVDLQHPYSLENFRQKVGSAEHTWNLFCCNERTQHDGKSTNCIYG